MQGGSTSVPPGRRSARPTQPVQVPPEAGKRRVAPVGQLHLDQIGRLGAGLEIGGHVVMEYAHATGGFDLPLRCELRRQLTWVEGLLGCQALALACVGLGAQLFEMAFEQVPVDQRRNPLLPGQVKD